MALILQDGYDTRVLKAVNFAPEVCPKTLGNPPQFD